MEIINANAAGIDVGSKSHFVAAGQALEDVKNLAYMLKIWLNLVSGYCLSESQQ